MEPTLFLRKVKLKNFSLLMFALLASSAAGAVTFVEVAEESEIHFRHTDGESGKRLFNEQYGAGGGFFDYDNDGYLDIYLINARPQGEQVTVPLPTNVLYHNNGDGSFTDVTSLAGMGDTRYGVGATTGDYDNDGDIDLYLTNFGDNALYRNNGDGTFTDVAPTAQVADTGWGTSCAFADFDNDGFLELYVSNYAKYTLDANKPCYRHNIAVYCGPSSYLPQPDVLYRNNRDGTFIDLTEQSGLLSVPAAHGLGVAIGDSDNDGDTDIYVANDQDFNFLFENLGDGTFEEVGLLSGVSCSDIGKAEAGMGVAFADYDNDGKLDLTVSNFQNETNTLYHNEGDNFFMDATIPAGIAEHTHRYLGWGIGFLDYDNDGYKDIFVANGHTMDNIAEVDRSTTTPQQNLLFRNLGDGKFENVTAAMGEGFALRKTSRAAAFGDYDNDGDIDILVTNWNQTVDLLKNEGGNRNNWIQVQAIGTKSNRSGIGARIKIVCRTLGGDELTQYAEVKSSGSYLAFSDLRVHFGVKDAERIDLLEIRWNSGIVDTVTNLPVNQRLIAVEGEEIVPQ
ncbi:CRTAC1 family protein [Candidatus Poribacteria bacterium]|nr:CRTAC1 family protein [Candidatus Poribacteria bacterium]